MRESGYYPPGAEFDSNAPYNETSPKEREFEIVCSQSLSKTVPCITNDYIATVEPENGLFEIDTSDTLWADVYHENEHYTPEQLINLFKRYLQSELNNEETIPKTSDFLKYLIKECEDWIVDETEYIES